jgi:hypothetical protein
LTRNRNIRSDSDAIRPATTLVFGNENNSTKVLSVHKTAINGSTIPAKVTSVTGLIVGSIMLEDVSLASVNLERAAAAKEVHDTTTSPVEDSVSNDGVMRKPIE